MKNRSNRLGRKLTGLFGKSAERRYRGRKLVAESLQTRALMAGDTYLPFHNGLIAEDTNEDNSVSAIDALLVINAINAGRTGALVSNGVGKGDGPMLDVSGDNYLSAIDALNVINRLNGSGEDPANPLAIFSYKILDINGVEIPSKTVSKGQLFQLQTLIQDSRPSLSAKGVSAAFLDIDYDNASKIAVNVGEAQSFRFFFDNLQEGAGLSSSYTFSVNTPQFGTETTAPISLLASDGAIVDAESLAQTMTSALANLQAFGAGNVKVQIDPVANADDTAAGIRNRINYEIRFINAKANQDIPLLTLNSGNVKTIGNTPFVADLFDKYPADPNNAAAFEGAFDFNALFDFNRNAGNGSGQFSNVGAASSSETQPSPRLAKPLFNLTLKAVETGVITFTPNNAIDALNDSPAYDTILVSLLTLDPATQIAYGSPFQVTIVDNMVANPDSVAVQEDSGTTQINAIANDQQLNGTGMTITSVGTPDNGGTATLVNTANGPRINYTPKANFFGTEVFTYVLTNSAGTATGTVTVTVTPQNDAITVASSRSKDTNLGVPVTFTTAEVTAGGDVGALESGIQTLSIGSAPSSTSKGGTVSLVNGLLTYTPSPTFFGTDSFVVVVTDSGSSTDVVNGVVQSPRADAKTQNVTITVNVVNHAPVATNDLIQDVDEDSTGNTLNVLANDNAGAGDNDSIVITEVGPRSQGGSVTIASDGKSLIYSPVAGVIGTETFTYTIQDRGGLTSQARVDVELQPTILPRARTDRENTNEDNSVTVNVLSNDRPNPGSNAVLIGVGSQPTNGTASKVGNSILYTPNGNFFGTDVFTYVMNDDSSVVGKVDSVGTVTITVVPVNDAPVLTSDQVNATEDIVATITSTTLLSNDSPGPGESAVQDLVITGVAKVSGTGGDVELKNGNVVYSPSADFNGTFIFSYTVTDRNKDGSVLSDAIPATTNVTITVAPVVDPPVVGNDSATTKEDVSLPLTATSLLSNDRPGPSTAVDELANETLRISSVSPTSQNGGRVALSQDGLTVTYSPADDFFGTDTFTYVATDSGSPASSTTATVTVTVTPDNDAPIATADSAVAFKGIPLTIAGTTLLANDRPGPANESGQTLTIKSVTPSANPNWTVVLSNGSIIFTPIGNYVGPATFQYTIEDNGKTGTADDFKTATATVSVDVKEFVPSRIAGYVYADEGRSRSKEANELTLGGVTVTLVGSALGVPVNLSQVTLADGSYEFGLLAPGTYTVSIVHPAVQIDGADQAGTAGDADGIADNNQFVIQIAPPGGIEALNYNFSVYGFNGAYGTVLDRLASTYYSSNPAMASNGIYFVNGQNNEAKWFSRLKGYENFVYAEAVANATNTSVYVTVVNANHEVYTATLGKGKFLMMGDGSGNTIIRVLGAFDQLPFAKVNLASPPVVPASRYLEAIDEVFGQEGW